VLRGPGGWKDLYMVGEYPPETYTMLTRDEISSLVIDTLHGQVSGQNMAVLCLYCDYQAQKEQSAVNMIGGLLRQVDWEVPGVGHEIRSAFNESNKRGGLRLCMQDMVKLFAKVISSIDRVYICVDGVDELLPENRSEFLQALGWIIQPAPKIRLFLTARSCIRKELGKDLAQGPCRYNIDIVADRRDIALYLSHMIHNDRDSGLMPDHLKNDIMETILGEASTM